MTENTADLGDKKRLQTTFTINSTNTDPDAVVMITKLPDGTLESYLSSSGFASQGSWDASANSPVLADGTGTVGNFYTVSVAGSVDFGKGAQTFAVDDYVAYDGESWVLIPSPQTDTLTSDATGVFYYDYPFHKIGVFYFRFEGFGTVHAADEIYIRVAKSAIR